MRAHAIAAALIANALAAGCEDARTSSSLMNTALDGGGQQLEARWRYRSSGVDVDIRLVTVEADGCSTSARLTVDKALAETDVYRLPGIDCSDLRLTETGDLVLRDEPTDHDWSAEAIDVDTDREVIRLGPWRDEEREITYRFTLAAPACEDDHDCECPQLERSANGEVAMLQFDRRCD